jgi:hypothetical protein
LEVYLMGRYANVGSLREAIDSMSGVLTLDIEHVRDAFGMQRIREVNVYKIESGLEDAGIGHIPRNLVGRKQGQRPALHEGFGGRSFHRGRAQAEDSYR